MSKTALTKIEERWGDWVRELHYKATRNIPTHTHTNWLTNYKAVMLNDVTTWLETTTSQLELRTQTFIYLTNNVYNYIQIVKKYLIN